MFFELKSVEAVICCAVVLRNDLWWASGDFYLRSTSYVFKTSVIPCSKVSNTLFVIALHSCLGFGSLFVIKALKHPKQIIKWHITNFMASFVIIKMQILIYRSIQSSGPFKALYTLLP